MGKHIEAQIHFKISPKYKQRTGKIVSKIYKLIDKEN